jgi:hypothetical protein
MRIRVPTCVKLGLGRAFNALALVKEAKAANDDVELVFDGAGVQWVGKL